jgi:hypothetical protein
VAERESQHRLPRGIFLRFDVAVRVARIHTQLSHLFRSQALPIGTGREFSTEFLYLICYLLSYAGAFVLARRIAGDEPWLSGEKSTRAFLLGAFLAPAPALLLLWHPFSLMVGLPGDGGPSIAIVNWLRETAGILAITPFFLVWLPRIKMYPGGRAESEKWPPLVLRDLVALAIELATWTAALWSSV